MMKKLFFEWTGWKHAHSTAAGAASEKKSVQECLRWAAEHDDTSLFTRFGSTENGMTEEMAERSRELYGENRTARAKKRPLYKKLADAFINPFSVVLIVLACISACTDVIFAAPGEKNYASLSVISSMVLISGCLRFVQETKSGNAAARLQGMIHTTAGVMRNGSLNEIPVEDIVVGDIIHLSAGDMIPADLRILRAKDLFVSQAALTGESEPVEKSGGTRAAEGALTELPNIAFMGSSVVSGSADAIAVAVGMDTMLGGIAHSLMGKPEKTGFEKGVSAVSWLLIRFMLLMVPIVFLINIMTGKGLMQAFLFSVSIAVGLTPEMLPMIVSTSLARGASEMSKKKVIIKNPGAIQNLGSIDILCTDKTGTLTRDRVILERHLNIDGETDERVLRHAFLNSYFQTGLRNLIDAAVIERQMPAGGKELIERYTKVDELPFDFERRRMSVVVQDNTGKRQMITKGAVEEMLACCSYAERGGTVVQLTDAVRAFVLAAADELNSRGMRVIAVAQKTLGYETPAKKKAGQHPADPEETDMVLLGFLAFLDPPKESAALAIKALREKGTEVKVLTGDNENVTRAICAQVGLPVASVLSGAQIEQMDDAALAGSAETCSVFAKLSPAQKERVVRVLRGNGHSVGFMGDGINDAPAMKAADVGISVDTAVDIAKEAASAVLLEKDLMVLEEGVLEGRKTYANMIKYIKMTVSSNFGNMLSVLVASIFLPFLPMMSVQLIFLNLIYDLSCTALPWDNADEAFLAKPRKWDASDISRFMLWMGPVSSVFDVLTFLLMYFVICPAAFGGQIYTQLSDPAAKAAYMALFQAGWFVESMWSQTLVIHMLRTPELPFIGSCASLPVCVLTALGILLITVIPYTPVAAGLGISPLPGVYFAWLLLIVALYLTAASVVKGIYIRKYKAFL